MLYVNESFSLNKNESLRNEVFVILNQIKKSELTVFSHVAHTYKNIKGTIRDMKRNYILFEGL